MRKLLAILLFLWGLFTMVQGPLVMDLKVEGLTRVTGKVLGMNGFSVNWSNGPLPLGDQEVVRVASETQSFLASPTGRIGVQIGRALGLLGIVAAIGVFHLFPFGRWLGILYGSLAIPFWLWWVWGTPTFSFLQRLVNGLQLDVIGATPLPSIVTNAPWIVTIAAVVFNALLLIACLSQPQKSRSR